MVEKEPCFKMFTEISFHNERLVVLGQEGLKVLEEKRKKGCHCQFMIHSMKWL